MGSRVVPAWFLLVLAGCGGSAPRFPGKSLILVSIDTLRADALGVFGEKKETSPALDRLAGETDPLEARNLARDPEWSPILDELRSLVAAHESRCSEREAALGRAETTTLSTRTLQELGALGYFQDDD